MNFKKLSSLKSKLFPVFRQLLFWFSNIAIGFVTIFFALSITGIDTGEVFPKVLETTNQFEWNRIFAYVPGAIVLLIMASAIYLTKKKRSTELFKLFFTVELPILLICFGKTVFTVYPITIFCLSIIILLSSLWIWWELMFSEKVKFLTSYNHLPLVVSMILSGWVFLIWVFWVPYALLEILKVIPEILGSILDIFEELFKNWYILPMVITGTYFLLSPGLAFGVFAYEFYQKKFPKKALTFGVILLVLVGGTLVFDIMDKHGSYAEFKQVSSSLNIKHNTEKVTFTSDQISEISNLNRFEESTKKAYLAGLKYPLSGKNEANAIHEAVYGSYCRVRYNHAPNPSCYLLAEIYEQLFFPFFYEGEFGKDRDLAQKVYAYVFDKNLQKELAEDINNLKKRSILGAESWNNSRRNVEAGVIHEFQEGVHLEEVNYEIDYNESLGIYTNLATFNFQNLRTSDQEVFIEFSLPNENSVITNLKLGMNLELASQVAPRGAAKKVYEESRSRSIDPALLEQVGPYQYQLRVFPVRSLKDGVTKGRQKVQIEYTAFVNSEVIEISPVMKMRNLKVDSKTKAHYMLKNEGQKVLAQGTIAPEKIKEGKEIITTEESALSAAIAVSETASVRFSREITSSEISSDWVFFVDNSASVDKEAMKDLFEKLKKLYNDGTFYSFNHEVAPIDSDLEFWGPTNTQSLVQFLVARQSEFSDKNLVIITDDSDFEINVEELTNINYSQSPVEVDYHVLVLGESIPSFKHELAKILVTEDLNIQNLQTDTDIEDLFQKKERLIWSLSESVEGEIEAPKWREAIEDLWAYEQSKKAIRDISDESSWMSVAKIQTGIAAKAHIVNQFNSLIALENDWQRERLKKAETEDDRYKSDHDIGEIPDGVIFNQSAPEPQFYLISLFIFSVFILLFSSDFKRAKFRIW